MICNKDRGQKISYIHDPFLHYNSTDIFKICHAISKTIAKNS